RWNISREQLVEMGKESPRASATEQALSDWHTRVLEFGLPPGLQPAQIAVDQYLKKLQARETSLFQRLFTREPELVQVGGMLLCRERERFSFVDRTRDTVACAIADRSENSYEVARAYVCKGITQRDRGGNIDYNLIK